MASPPAIKQADAGEDDWLVTYADAITLLMAFFVIMFSISEPNTEKFERVTRGMVETLSRKDVEAPVTPNSGDQANVDTTTIGRTVQFQTGKMFAPGSADILPEAYAQLDRLSQNLILLGNTRYGVIVEGHTDDNPITNARFASNWELSAARATNVVRLFGGAEIPVHRMRAVAFAETQPKVPNRDGAGNPLPENQAKNRRIIIRVHR